MPRRYNRVPSYNGVNTEPTEEEFQRAITRAIIDLNYPEFKRLLQLRPLQGEPLNVALINATELAAINMVNDLLNLGADPAALGGTSIKVAYRNAKIPGYAQQAYRTILDQLINHLSD